MQRSPFQLGLGAGLLALLVIALAPHDASAKKKKSAEPVAPKLGWVQEEGWKNACYYPPDWASLDEMDRRSSRAKVLGELEKQWSGARSDGVSFTPETIEDADTTLLGRPECMLPLDYTMFDYLEIGTGWQRPLSICQGNKIRISGTPKDKYRVRDDGPWITVAGDPAKPTFGGDWPCNVEGCLEGMLTMKFVTLAGVEIIIPVGNELTWTAPEHGEISYRINDTTFYDNTWFKSGSMQDRTAIEISPGQ